MLLTACCLAAAMVAADLPVNWHPTGRAIPSSNGYRPTVVDLSGKYIYAEGIRWDIQTGTRQYIGFGGYREGQEDKFHAWLKDSPEPSGDEPGLGAPVSMIFADEDRLVGYLDPSTLYGSFREGVVSVEVNGPFARRATDEDLKKIERSPSIWVSRYSYSGIVPSLFGYAVTAREVEEECFYRYIPSSVSSPPDFSTKPVPGIHPLLPARNGVDWSSRRAYAVSGGGRIGPYYELSMSKPHMTVLRRFTRPWSAERYDRQFFIRLKDGSLVDSFRLEAIPGGDPPRKFFTTYVLDKGFQTWTHYEGLRVFGASTDGRFVIYSNYPWKEFRVAEVE